MLVCCGEEAKELEILVSRRQVAAPGCVLARYAPESLAGVPRATGDAAVRASVPCGSALDLPTPAPAGDVVVDNRAYATRHGPCDGSGLTARNWTPATSIG